MFEWYNEPIRLTVVGDIFVSEKDMENAARENGFNISKVNQIRWGADTKDEFARKQLEIERKGPDAVPYAKDLDSIIGETDVLIVHFCPVPKSLLEKAKNLKALLVCRGGHENICLDEATRQKIPVYNVIRNAEPVSEFTIGMMIALTRCITISSQNLKKGLWQKEFYNSSFMRTLNSHTVGLMGLGNVGKLVAKKLHGLGVPVIAYDPFYSTEILKREKMEYVKLITDLKNLTAQADIVSLHLRLTPETAGICDYDFFTNMKKTAYFINTARGGLVNQQDLILALKEKKIAGAALDVFEREPLDYDSPLLQMDNVIATSHIAGLTLDAIEKSPYTLMREIRHMADMGTTERIINYHDIQNR